jgi:Protein of unknown function (DUF3108)
LAAFILGIAPSTHPDPAFAPARLKVGPAAPTSMPSPKPLPDGIAEPPIYKVTTPVFHEGQNLVFQASWIGIPVATARIELHRKKKDPGLWTAEAWIETNEFADLLFKMRDYMTEDLDHQSLISRKLYIRQSENKRLNDFNADFDRNAGLVTLVKHNRKGKQVKRFISTNPWGPLSGAMLALSLPMTPGQRYAIDVFTGSTRYIFNFKVGDREKITTQLGTFDAYRLVPDVDYESDGKLSQSATGIAIWVSADDRRLPLRAEAQSFVGKIRADLIQTSG